MSYMIILQCRIVYDNITVSYTIMKQDYRTSAELKIDYRTHKIFVLHMQLRDSKF